MLRGKRKTAMEYIAELHPNKRKSLCFEIYIRGDTSLRSFSNITSAAQFRYSARCFSFPSSDFVFQFK